MTEYVHPRAQAMWENEVLPMHPKLAEYVAAIGSPPVRWYYDPASAPVGNAHYIFREVWPNGFPNPPRQTFVEVKMRDSSMTYDDPTLRYVVWHEAGHIAAHMMAMRGRYGDIHDVYRRYQLARGIGGPIVMAGDWPTLTQEHFGDDFFYATQPPYDSSQGGSQPASATVAGALDPAAMLAFFTALVREELPVIKIVDAFPVNTDAAGNWSGWVNLPAGLPTTGKIMVMPQRDGVAGSEPYGPVFGAKVDRPNNRVFVMMWNDTQKSAQAWVRLVVMID